MLPMLIIDSNKGVDDTAMKQLKNLIGPEINAAKSFYIPYI